MPDGDWQQQRADLIAEIDRLLGSAEGIALIVFVALLALSAIAVSGLLLVLLRRDTPAVSIPAPRWGGPEVLLFLCGWFALQLILGSFILSLLPPAPPGEFTGLIERNVRLPVLSILQIVAGGLGGLIVAGGILLLPRIFAQPLTTLGIGTGSMGQGARLGFLIWASAIPGAFALFFAWGFALTLIGIEPDEQNVVDLFRGSFSEGNWGPALTVMFFGIGVAPVVEELLFRVVVYRWFARRLGVVTGVILSALLFGLIHMSLFALLPITLLGVLLALVFERTGNIWACIALHAIFNSGQFLLMILVEGMP